MSLILYLTFSYYLPLFISLIFSSAIFHSLHPLCFPFFFSSMCLPPPFLILCLPLLLSLFMSSIAYLLLSPTYNESHLPFTFYISHLLCLILFVYYIFYVSSFVSCTLYISHPLCFLSSITFTFCV